VTAFEAGTMPEASCALRLAELSDRRTELAAHRDQLQVQLRSTAPDTPSRQELEGLAAKARNALTEGSPEQIRQTLAALLDRVEISADRQARPWFRIPGAETNRPGPSLARACGIPVRMGPRHVGPTCQHPNQTPIVADGPEMLIRPDGSRPV
jgi:hypothetical protein